MPLVNSITAYDQPDGNTYILRINEALGMIEQDRVLMCPFQMRANELIIGNFLHIFLTKGRGSRLLWYFLE